MRVGCYIEKIKVEPSTTKDSEIYVSFYTPLEPTVTVKADSSGCSNLKLTCHLDKYDFFGWKEIEEYTTQYTISLSPYESKDVKLPTLKPCENWKPIPLDRYRIRTSLNGSTKTLEFVVGIVPKIEHFKDAWELLNYYDTDKDGVISGRELLRAISDWRDGKITQGELYWVQYTWCAAGGKINEFLKNMQQPSIPGIPIEKPKYIYYGAIALACVALGYAISKIRT